VVFRQEGAGLASDEVSLIVQRYGDGVDDLERIDALGLEITETHDHPAAVAQLHQRCREQIRLGAEGPCQVDIPRSEQPWKG